MLGRVVVPGRVSPPLPALPRGSTSSRTRKCAPGFSPLVITGRNGDPSAFSGWWFGRGRSGLRETVARAASRRSCRRFLAARPPHALASALRGSRRSSSPAGTAIHRPSQVGVRSGFSDSVRRWLGPRLAAPAGLPRVDLASQVRSCRSSSPAGTAISAFDGGLIGIHGLVSGGSGRVSPPLIKIVGGRISARTGATLRLQAASNRPPVRRRLLFRLLALAREPVGRVLACKRLPSGHRSRARPAPTGLRLGGFSGGFSY